MTTASLTLAYTNAIAKALKEPSGDKEGKKFEGTAADSSTFMAPIATPLPIPVAPPAGVFAHDSPEKAGTKSGNKRKQAPGWAVPKTRTKRSRLGRRRTRPKNSRSAYVYYVMYRRSHVSKEEDGLGFGAFARKIGQQWRTLPPEERKQFDALARQDRTRYLREKAQWVAARREMYEAGLMRVRQEELRSQQAARTTGYRSQFDTVAVGYGANPSGGTITYIHPSQQHAIDRSRDWGTPETRVPIARPPAPVNQHNMQSCYALRNGITSRIQNANKYQTVYNMDMITRSNTQARLQPRIGYGSVGVGDNMGTVQRTTAPYSGTLSPTALSPFWQSTAAIHSPRASLTQHEQRQFQQQVAYSAGYTPNVHVIQQGTSRQQYTAAWWQNKGAQPRQVVVPVDTLQHQQQIQRLRLLQPRVQTQQRQPRLHQPTQHQPAEHQRT